MALQGGEGGREGATRAVPLNIARVSANGPAGFSLRPQLDRSASTEPSAQPKSGAVGEGRRGVGGSAGHRRPSRHAPTQVGPQGPGAKRSSQPRASGRARASVVTVPSSCTHRVVHGVAQRFTDGATARAVASVAHRRAVMKSGAL